MVSGKRKGREARDLKRKSPSMEAHKRVLIVCEGEKTEPLYFQGLKRFYQLNSDIVEITGDCGSSPNSVWEEAQMQYQKSKKLANPYDKVYCVFDRDMHSTYTQTVQAIRSKKPKDTFFAITSNPCFEYWLLLHFRYTTKSYCPISGKSSADRVIEDLKTFLPNYSKGYKNIFSELSSKLDDAITNAKRANQEADLLVDSPSTYVGDLVLDLKALNPMNI